MALPDYLQDTAKDFAKQLTATTSVPINTGTFTGRQFVAGEDPMQTQAINLATQGVGSYQPFLTAAQGAVSQQAGLTGPQAFQQFMSPFQQQVIDTTLAYFDRQAAMGRQNIRDQAFTSGAFGGGREGIAQAEYANTAARNRAALQAQLLGQGFTQANQLAQQAFEQQRNLASLQPSLSASGVQQLGAAGTGNLAFQQAQLDAAQQRAQLAYQEPLSRIQAFGSGIASQASGSPMTTTQQSMGGGTVGPFSQAVAAGLNAYGLGSIFGGGR